MALWKVVIQKPVIGKSKPSELDLIRNRRVVLVDARNAAEVEHVLKAFREDVQGVVEFKRTESLQVLAP